RPAAAPARVRPGPVSGPAPAAGPQVRPSGEVMTTGCWLSRAEAESRVPPAPSWAAGPPSPPTASQPTPPRATLVRPGPWPRHDGGVPAVAGDHRPPGARDQIAGAPSAWPTATWPSGPAPRPLTLRSAAAAPARAAWPTCRRCFLASSRKGPGWLAPAATTTPAGPTVTPVTAVVEDRPR